MTAYFIKCRNVEINTESISTRLFYFQDEAENAIKQLNAKNDGYFYFLHKAQI